jgi:hypothetical protein
MQTQFLRYPLLDKRNKGYKLHTIGGGSRWGLSKRSATNKRRSETLYSNEDHYISCRREKHVNPYMRSRHTWVLTLRMTRTFTGLHRILWKTFLSPCHIAGFAPVGFFECWKCKHFATHMHVCKPSTRVFSTGCSFPVYSIRVSLLV